MENERKRGLLLNNATGILGAALMAFSKAAQSYEMLIIGRLIIGFNCGIRFFFLRRARITCILSFVLYSRSTRFEHVVGADVHFRNSATQFAGWSRHRQSIRSYSRHSFLADSWNSRDPRNGEWLASASRFGNIKNGVVQTRKSS